MQETTDHAKHQHQVPPKGSGDVVESQPIRGSQIHHARVLEGRERNIHGSCSLAVLQANATIWQLVADLCREVSTGISSITLINCPQ